MNKQTKTSWKYVSDKMWVEKSDVMSGFPAVNHSVCVCLCVCAGNCMDSKWLNVNAYTPSSPEDLQVSVDTRQDETGQLQPVLIANWKIQDDGESVCEEVPS